MYFPGTIIELGEFNLNPILEWAETAPENYWTQYPFREKGKTHQFTQSIFILYDERGIKERKQEFFDKFMPIVLEARQRVFSRLVLDLSLKRLLIVRMQPNSFIRPHKDSGTHLETTWRCHFALRTHPNVKFTVGDDTRHFEQNHGYIINNQKRHSVVNDSDITRIHMIMDFG